MQILLTEDEYAGLVPKAEIEQANVAISIMRDVIVGETCIHAPPSKKQRFNYCCECPLSDIRRGSQLVESIPREVSKLMCSRPREYAQ